MKKFIFVTILFSISLFSCANHKAHVFIKDANTFLSTYVNEEGMVDYESITNSPDELNDLVEVLIESKLGSDNSSFAKAFKINAYNILVIKGIVDHYPVERPLDIKGFFDEIKYNIGGEKITLNELEHEKIRSVFNDARIHFALVCAAKGCPKLLNQAYTESNVNDLLEQQAINTINDPKFVRIKPDSELVVVSEIFSWYKEDFTSEKGSIKKYINTYLEKGEKAPKDYKLVTYPYNWKLNGQ